MVVFGGAVKVRKSKTENVEIVDNRRKLSYFGDPKDGSDTLYQKHVPIPAFKYISEQPFRINKGEEIILKERTVCRLRVNQEYNFDRFLVASERENVLSGAIRSQCEGVLSAKTYQSAEEDRGVYTVIPEIDGSDISVDAVYKMWLALECAMMRRECLIIVDDPALAQVTKFRTEQWRLLNRLVGWGCYTSLFFACILRQFPSLILFPFCLAAYGYGKLRTMKLKDPASHYSECCTSKQYDMDPDSHIVCDAQISLKYLRCPQYRMFKLENYEKRDKENSKLIGVTCAFGLIQILRHVYSRDFIPLMIHRGHDHSTLNPMAFPPLNVFTQLKNRFLTFGNTPGVGRADTIHWLIQNGLVYYFFIRHIPWAFQTFLEYYDREHMMATAIRYLQFRNLCGEERYEFPARNLYWTMQKDYPDNRILHEMYDHFNVPPKGYYESEDFVQTREPKKPTMRELVRRLKISYYRNW